jgi:hypothetical protein
MKYSQYIGVAAAIILVGACFLPWAFYPDLNKDFTGFFSEQNNYGRPGKLFSILAVIATTLFLIPKIWAKRWNLLIGAITVAYAIKSFVLFSSCYNTICPEKKIGIWIMLLASFVLLIMTFLPDLKVIEKEKK